jgi:hypothetical protein
MIAGPFERMRASVFDDGSPSMPTPDVCQARFINATPDLTIDVTVRGLDTNFSSLGFMHASPYGRLPKGVYDVEIKDRTSHGTVEVPPISTARAGIEEVQRPETRESP